MPEQKIDITTADGVDDARFYTPATGSGPWPAVIMLTDIFGVRGAFEGMAQRLADEGFAVLLPNLYFRVGKAPLPQPEGGMANPASKEILMGWRGTVSTIAALKTDMSACIDWLAQAPGVKAGKIGVVGYCMSGGMALQTAADFPDRVGAAASFHGGGLARDDAESPHNSVAKIKAKVLIGHASDDASIPPAMQDKLHAALDEAKVDYTAEVYGGGHGWCVPGMGHYHEAEAERAYGELVALFKDAL
jgi:carboxymethylenebutenolidase